MSSGDAQVAQAAINSAESRMSSVYKSVLAAEKEGANVSSLLVKLNTSAALLSMAQMQNRTGNFIEAELFADQCYNFLDGIETEAASVRDNAILERNQRMLVSSIGSAVGICAVLIASIVGWHYFKARYSREVLEMKPEVQANDS